MVSLSSQESALITTIVIFVLSLALAVVLTRKYMRTRNKAQFYWSIGLWLFAVAVLMEIFFAANIYSVFWGAAYLLIVVVLVEFLALGSMELTKSKRWKTGYVVFVVAATAFTIFTLLASDVGNIIASYVVAGNLPLWVVISSSIATFAASIVIVVVAGKSYLKSKNKKLLSIIAGVIVVAVAGTLYIVQYPAFLYLAEFLGILLLWIGFI